MIKTGRASGLRRRKGCRAVLRDWSLDTPTQMPCKKARVERKTGQLFHTGYLFLLSYKKDVVRMSESFNPANPKGFVCCCWRQNTTECTGCHVMWQHPFLYLGKLPSCLQQSVLCVLPVSCPLQPPLTSSDPFLCMSLTCSITSA